MTSSHTPRRIACLQPSATVILAAIGELERVVACTKYCADVVPEITAQSRIILHDSWTSSASEIIAAQPDLVIASVPYQEKAVVEILKAGVRFLGLAPRNLADIYSDIAIIAGAVGASECGEAVIEHMQQRIEQIRRQLISQLGAANGKTSADYIVSVLKEAGIRVVWSTRSDTECQCKWPFITCAQARILYYNRSMSPSYQRGTSR